MWFVGTAGSWTDPQVVIGGGTLIGALVVALGLVRRTSSDLPKAYIEQIDTMSTSIDRLEASNAALHKANKLQAGETMRCEQRVSILIRAMQRAGIDVPAEVWDA